MDKRYIVDHEHNTIIDHEHNTFIFRGDNIDSSNVNSSNALIGCSEIGRFLEHVSDFLHHADMFLFSSVKHIEVCTGLAARAQFSSKIIEENNIFYWRALPNSINTMRVSMLLQIQILE